MTTHHTPGPWYAREWSCHAATTVMVDDSASLLGKRVIAECDSDADAARIVQCVNAHDDLVAAAFEAKGFILGFEDDDTQVGIRALLDRLQAALVKAGHVGAAA